MAYYYYGKEAGYQNVFLTDDLTYWTGFTPTTQNYFNKPYDIGNE